MLGPQDLALGLLLAVFFFGAKRLPELAGSLGKSMKEFKKAVEGTDAEPEAPKAPGELPPAAPARRACATCQSPVESDWQHCPRCGSVVSPAPTP